MAPKRTRTDGAPKKSSTQGNRPLPPSKLNKFNIKFANVDHKKHYDVVASRQISEPKYLDKEFLERINVWDDMATLLDSLGLLGFMDLQYGVYERLVVEFFSSLFVDWTGTHDNGQTLIRFQLFNKTHTLNLDQFKHHLRITSSGLRECKHEAFKAIAFWQSITCEERPHYRARNGISYVTYDPRQSKSSAICNPILRYLQRLLANTLFARYECQNVVRRAELFCIWAALHNHRVDTGALLLIHLEGQVKNPKGRIAAGGIITALAMGLELAQPIQRLDPLFLGGRLNSASCTLMQMFISQPEGLAINHHDFPLFILPSDFTTLRERSNWSYVNPPDAMRAAVGEEEGADDTDDDPTIGQEDLPTDPIAGSSGARDISSGPTSADFPTILSHLVEIRGQLHRIERRLSYAYEQNGWPEPPSDWQPRGPPPP